MFGFVRGVRGRAVVVVLVVAGLLGGVTAGSVAAARSTTVTWNVSSLTAGQVKSLSNVATTNSSGVKTWSKTGSCTLSPKSQPTQLTMGTGSSCTLTLKIAKTSKYPAKTSTKTITRKSSSTTTTVAPTTTTVAPTTTTTTVAPTTTTVAPVLYEVGDVGPGGGIVFYVDLTRPAGSQYFEAACAGWQNNCDGSRADPRAEWGCYETLFFGAGGTLIGTGEQNTADIMNTVTGCTTPRSAADLADDYSHNTLDDWFLPSLDELNQMYTNLHSASTPLGGFSTDYYWSSSEADDALAWYQDFNYGAQDVHNEYNTFYVRPVRAFSGSDAPTTTTVAPTTTTTLAPVPLYSVGDTGPGGGTIFYVDLTRVEGSQYFEAACVGWSDGTCGGDDLTDPTAEWGCWGTSYIGAHGTAIGTGEQNTTDIVTGCATAGIAARRANDLVLGGQSDWFLPSKDELNRMYIWRTAIGGFSTHYYWSSSEYDLYIAWFQLFFNPGNQRDDSKHLTYYVRPVRAF